ncbi:hypothetical protein GUK21_31875 [Rhizobium leguminosarum]|uniref:tetratricopeptide repeat protein n=1 Tax=Rhizobium ruizarguesonis TaxID=2081791 RepID=UPI0013CB72AE|nr:tetratricopeptide repeat protein [Rhizobium ruizarguesonis]NEJ60774.1 hypothetical protein [Rhizobium ruizarguesonis]
MLNRIHYIAIAIVALVALIAATQLSTRSHDKAASEAVRARADKGDPGSQYEMALRYEQGDGVPVAYYQVGYYLRLAALQNHPQARAKIKELHALCSSLSPYNLAPNPKRTLEQAHACQADAEVGDRDAQLVVAILHDTGDMLEKNHVMAAVWFKAAATHGDPTAQFMLARSYSKAGPFPNPVEEYAWLATAAANSEMPAQLAPLAAATKVNVGKKFVAQFGAQAFQDADDKARLYISKYNYQKSK